VELMPRRIPLHRRLLYLSVPYVILALLLFGIEGATRFFLPHISLLKALIQPQVLRLSVDTESTLFIGDPLLFWRVQPNLKDTFWDFTPVSTNAQGLRRDGDVGRKRPDGFRIVCLGDSVTFGYRIPLISPTYPLTYPRDVLPYPLLLEKRLRETNPGRRIEVLPLAVPAYTTYQGLNWLRRDIDSLKPDVVTACFGWNDVGLRAQSDRQVMPVDWLHVTVRWLMSHSQAMTHLTQWRRTRNAKTDPPMPPAITQRVPQTEYVANLLEIARIARTHGAQPLLIGPVYQNAVANPSEAAFIKQYRDALRAAAESNAVPYLEVQELTEKNFPANTELFDEHVHPNSRGHQVMASELLKFFATHETLKPLTVPQSL
jgi:lysophospholipase L1-like esterase